MSADSLSGGFLGLPATVPDARFGTVNQYLSAVTSNYNGLTVSLRHAMSAGLSFNLSYTSSHALDMVSSGGLEQFNLQTDPSIICPQNPNNIRANYGDADRPDFFDVDLGLMKDILIKERVTFSFGVHLQPPEPS